MKKLILSMVFVFATVSFTNAAILSNRDCNREAFDAGNEAEAAGFSYEDAYLIAINTYSQCTGEPIRME